MNIRSFSLLGLLALALAASAAGQAVRARTIVVKTEPKAIVWLNGVRYGTTDAEGKLEIKNAPAGRQNIRVRADGFKETSKAVLPAQTGNVDILLVKTTDEAELAYQEAERLAAIDPRKGRGRVSKRHQDPARLRRSLCRFSSCPERRG